VDKRPPPQDKTRSCTVRHARPLPWRAAHDRRHLGQDERAEDASRAARVQGGAGGCTLCVGRHQSVIRDRQPFLRYNQPNMLSFAGNHGKQPCQKVSRKRGTKAAGLAKAGPCGGYVTGTHVPGEVGSSSRSSHAPATEGVRATRVGVTNLGASNRHRGELGRREPWRAPEPRKLGWSGLERGRATQGDSPRGQLRVRGTGFRRSRSCSWIVEIAGFDVRCPPSPGESRRRGLFVEARRSGLAKIGFL